MREPEGYARVRLNLYEKEGGTGHYDLSLYGEFGFTLSYGHYKRGACFTLCPLGAWTKYDPREYAYHYIDFLVPTDQLRDYMDQWFCKKARGRLLEAGEDFRRYAVALKGFKRYDAKGGVNCLTFFDLFLRELQIDILSAIACRPVEETHVSGVIRLERIAPYLNNQDAPISVETGFSPGTGQNKPVGWDRRLRGTCTDG